MDRIPFQQPIHCLHAGYSLLMMGCNEVNLTGSLIRASMEGVCKNIQIRKFELILSEKSDIRIRFFLSISDISDSISDNSDISNNIRIRNYEYYPNYTKIYPNYLKYHPNYPKNNSDSIGT